VRYTNIILESLRSVALRRVRIKVDPRLVSAEADLAKCDGYEGYVLEECANNRFKILVLSSDLQIQDIPAEFLEAIVAESEIEQFESFKKYTLVKLLKDGLAENNPVLEQIINTNNINDIEILISQHGYTGDSLTQLYKNFTFKLNEA